MPERKQGRQQMESKSQDQYSTLPYFHFLPESSKLFITMPARNKPGTSSVSYIASHFYKFPSSSARFNHQREASIGN